MRDIIGGSTTIFNQEFDNIGSGIEDIVTNYMSKEEHKKKCKELITMLFFELFELSDKSITDLDGKLLFEDLDFDSIEIVYFATCLEKFLEKKFDVDLLAASICDFNKLVTFVHDNTYLENEEDIIIKKCNEFGI